MNARRVNHQPGDAILHPVALAGVALLVVNDHLLKGGLAPAMLTGKLSDFAGLAFFPLFLLGAWEVALAALRRWRGPTRRALVVAIGATGAAFSLVNITRWGADLFALSIGAVQWLPASAVTWVLGLPPAQLRPGAVTLDPTDLLALPALAVPLVIGWLRWESAQAAAMEVTA